VKALEEIEGGKTADELWRTEVRDELSDIKTRTFGILILQIFRTLKFFFGLLPQGRVILLIVAAVGLIAALIDDGELSGDAIRDAVKATGLNKFIDEILDQVNEIVGELAEDASELADVVSQVFVSVAGKGEGIESAIEGEIRNISRVLNERIDPSVEEALTALRGALQGFQEILPDVTQVTNAASNSDLFIGPALRGLDNRMREIPTLALKLVRLT